MANFLETLGASFILVFGLMALLWVVYYFKRNAGIVDLGWPIGFILIAIATLLIGPGDFIKKSVLTGMIILWGIRLEQYLVKRFSWGHEDPRYSDMRKNWGQSHSDLKFLALFLFQAFLILIISTPLYIVALNARSEWHSVEIGGIVVFALALIGEYFSDAQMEQFKQNPNNANRVCERGLWRYSRHPNYFFEFMIWLGIFLFAFPTPGGVIATISPILMLYLLVKFSGVPLSEAQALKTKGEGYREYQKTTSPFIPWFRKKIKD